MKSIALNKILSIATITAVSVSLFSSCNKTEGSGTIISDNTLSVRAEIEQQNAKDLTRATVSKANFQDGDEIGVWVVPFKITGATDADHQYIDLRPIGNYKDNVQHRYSSGKFNSSETIYFLNSGNNMDVYAVYPYDASMSDETNNTMADPKAYEFAVAQDQSPSNGSGVTSSDFLTAKNVATVENGVSLSFKHRMTRVLVGFNLPEKYEGNTVTAVRSVELLNQQLKTQIDISDPTKAPQFVSAGNPASSITMYKAESPSSSVGVTGDYVYECIIAPGYSVNDEDAMVVIQIVAGGKDFTLTAYSTSQVTFQHQTQYNINVQLSDRPTMNPGSISIAGWGDPIVVNASTSKLHKMIFKVINDNESIDPGDINGTANITIAEPGSASGANGITTVADISYTGSATANEGTYTIMYDSNGKVGGQLTRIQITKGNGTQDLVRTTAVSLRIEGDPSDQNYDKVIGTITFNSNSTIDIN